MISSAPDTSATLFGPVHLGATGNGIETATAPAAAAAPSAAIVATPVSEKKPGHREARGGQGGCQQRQRKGQGKYPRKAQTDAAQTRGARQEEGPLPHPEEGG